MSPEELKAYKRDKSKKFNAHLRDLRLKDKENKKIADQQDNTIDKQDGNQDDNLQRNQEDNLQRNQEDNLSLQDLMDIYETLENKLDLIDNKLETIMENKLYETLDTKMDIIQNKLETIMENKLENKLEPNTLLPQFKPIFFA